MVSSWKKRLKHVSYVSVVELNNLLVWEPEVEVLEVVEGLRCI